MDVLVVLPVYNEQGAIYSNFVEIHDRLSADGVQARYLLVDDGSKDRTWDEIQTIAKEYRHVHAIGFSRNFGKELAIRAALDYQDAEYYVIMDSDLQHPPRHIRPMLELMQKTDVDIVNGKKSSRGKESLSYKLFAGGFYSMMKRFSGLDMRGGSDFKILRKRVVDEIRRFGEKDGLFRGFVDWVGFKSTDYYFDVEPRKAGETSFSFLKLVKIAVTTIVGHSSKPLLLTMNISVLFFIFAIILGVQTLINFFSGKAISGFSTVILLQLIIGSATLFCLGLIGIYIAKIYEEVKGRPTYIIDRHL